MRSTLESFVWSSYGAYLAPPNERPPWLRVGRLLGEKGIPKESAAGRRALARRMEASREREESADYRAVRRGWWTVEEPGIPGKVNAAVYYGEWAAGKSFAISAWAAQAQGWGTPGWYFQAVGDPFVRK